MGSIETNSRIFVVEGYPANQDLIKIVLGEEGFYPEFVETVEEAYRLLGTLTPALVIIALSPEKTVTEKILFEALNEKNVPSLALDWALYPHPTPQQIEERKALVGATEIIPKPFELDNFICQVESLINSRGFRTGKQPSPVLPHPEPE